MKKMYIFLLFSLFILSGCSLFTGIGRLTCEFLPDGDHCQQFIAVQSSDPSRCEKIKGEDFKEAGSNPPRDRCYLMIAENTGDLSVCRNMKGGLYSYEPDDCLLATALKHNLFDQCDQMMDFPNKYASCKTELVSLKNIGNFDNEIQKLESEYLQDWKNEKLKKQLEELKAKKDSLYTYLAPSEQGVYFREQREKIFESVYDTDVQLAIAKQYNDYKNSLGQDISITSQLEKVKEFKDTQETIKRLDEHANTLHDEIMGALGNMAETGKEELKEYMIQEAYKKSSEAMKWELARLEGLKNQYDSANAYYKDITEKYNKIKDAYDGIIDIQNKISAFDQMVLQGKLTDDKARVLKGAVLLGTGLEQVTAYVPVFGSTISTVSKETFDVVTKFATKRAQRTTALDKCIEDPLNCDTDSITGY